MVEPKIGDGGSPRALRKPGVRAPAPRGTTKIACVQMEARVGEADRNVERSAAFVRQAAEAGANLVVLPELCNSGYAFQSREEAFSLAEELPSGPACRAWSEACSEFGTHVVAGVCERDGDSLFNSSVVLGPDGHVGTFRKLHLWNEENLYFEPGNVGLPVFNLPFGRVGTFICYDCWFPETFRLCAAQGADIICIPTNWVPIPGQEEGQIAMANVLCMGNAHVNSVYVAAADRIATERGQEFIGQSVILSYTGWPIGGPASTDREEIVYADVNVSDARRKRHWNAFNQPLRDRRKDVYAEMLGANMAPGAY